MRHPFSQIDVFTLAAFKGNPLAVIHDADDLSDDDMASIARWTNLSETTFLLKPRTPAAHYRVRIFTPGGELPFAGHPTLGSAFAWLRAQGLAQPLNHLVQECEVGLIDIKLIDQKFYFKAPPLRRSGPLASTDLTTLIHALSLRPEAVVHHQWVDNGPGWCALYLDSAETVLKLNADHPDLKPYKLGIIGPYPKGHEVQFEVRAFVGSLGVPEDPVTGSLNAGIASWLFKDGLMDKPYVVSQGTALAREGRVFVEQAADGIWIGGHVCPVIDGTIDLSFR